jgi:hypothetical protein
MFPVGHYAGAFHSQAATEPECYRVRTGWDDHELSRPSVRLWALAHGLPDRLNEGVAWTRNAVLEASGADGPGPAGLDDLLAAGLLTEVVPHSGDVVAFARRHRLQPLMVGLGNLADDPTRWAIGFGDTAVITVPVLVYHVWKYAHLEPDLWSGCAAVADMSAWHDGTATPVRDLVAEVVGLLHPLLACSAAYLDRVDES